MTPTHKTRKPIDKLTEEDLKTFPMWEYVLDEEGDFDETYVRPLDLETIPPDSYSISVAARYTLNCGAEYLGFVMVSTGGDLVEILPGFIFAGGTAVGLPDPPPKDAMPGIDRGIDLTRANLPKGMNLPIDQILPANYQLLVRLEGEENLREGVAS